MEEPQTDPRGALHETCLRHHLVGLLPVLWSQGTGADVMKRIAAPMVGGVVTSAMLELLVYPALYAVWKVRVLPATAAE